MNEYSTVLQSSSTYDSLYEPITPRPPSGMSSNYSTLYYGKTPSSNRSEAEVDALTNLLVQSMDSPSTDPEFFGLFLSNFPTVITFHVNSLAINE